jgi:hypothetical protein
LENRNTAAAVAWKWRRPGGDDGTGAARAHAAAAARKQGVTGLLVGLAVALLFHFAFGRTRMALFVGGVAVILAAIAFLFPLTLHKKIAAGLALFGHGVGTAVTWVLMTVLYYLLFLPVGLVLRAGGKLRLDRGRPAAGPARASYWIPTEGTATLESYRRQF